MYINSEKETDTKTANELEDTASPTLHLSAIDGANVHEASQIIFHKMQDGKLFIEYWANELMVQNGITPYNTLDLDNEARKKLVEFLNHPQTY